jgi:hypothetical protein
VNEIETMLVAELLRRNLRNPHQRITRAGKFIADVMLEDAVARNRPADLPTCSAWLGTVEVETEHNGQSGRPRVISDAGGRYRLRDPLPDDDGCAPRLDPWQSVGMHMPGPEPYGDGCRHVKPHPALDDDANDNPSIAVSQRWKDR